MDNQDRMHFSKDYRVFLVLIRCFLTHSVLTPEMKTLFHCAFLIKSPYSLISEFGSYHLDVVVFVKFAIGNHLRVALLAKQDQAAVLQLEPDK